MVFKWVCLKWGTAYNGCGFLLGSLQNNPKKVPSNGGWSSPVWRLPLPPQTRAPEKGLRFPFNFPFNQTPKRGPTHTHFAMKLKCRNQLESHALGHERPKKRSTQTNWSVSVLVGGRKLPPKPDVHHAISNQIGQVGRLSASALALKQSASSEEDAAGTDPLVLRGGFLLVLPQLQNTRVPSISLSLRPVNCCSASE